MIVSPPDSVIIILSTSDKDSPDTAIELRTAATVLSLGVRTAFHFFPDEENSILKSEYKDSALPENIEERVPEMLRNILLEDASITFCLPSGIVCITDVMPTARTDGNGFCVFHIIPSRLNIKVPLEFKLRLIFLIVFTCVKFPVMFGCSASFVHTDLKLVSCAYINTHDIKSTTEKYFFIFKYPSFYRLDLNDKSVITQVC